MSILEAVTKQPSNVYLTLPDTHCWEQPCCYPLCRKNNRYCEYDHVRTIYCTYHRRLCTKICGKINCKDHGWTVNTYRIFFGDFMRDILIQEDITHEYYHHVTHSIKIRDRLDMLISFFTEEPENYDNPYEGPIWTMINNQQQLKEKLNRDILFYSVKLGEYFNLPHDIENHIKTFL